MEITKKMNNMIKLQKTTIIALILVIISIYLHAAIIYSIVGKEMFLSDPKDLKMSLWAQFNSALWMFGTYVIIGLFIISLPFYIRKSEVIKMSTICFVLLILNCIDPFGIINWILD